MIFLIKNAQKYSLRAYYTITILLKGTSLSSSKSFKLLLKASFADGKFFVKGLSS
jgi:hypothetical protein